MRKCSRRVDVIAGSLGSFGPQFENLSVEARSLGAQVYYDRGMQNDVVEE